MPSTRTGSWSSPTSAHSKTSSELNRRGCCQSSGDDGSSASERLHLSALAGAELLQGTIERVRRGAEHDGLVVPDEDHAAANRAEHRDPALEWHRAQRVRGLLTGLCRHHAEQSSGGQREPPLIRRQRHERRVGLKVLLSPGLLGDSLGNRVGISGTGVDAVCVPHATEHFASTSTNVNCSSRSFTMLWRAPASRL